MLAAWLIPIERGNGCNGVGLCFLPVIAMIEGFTILVHPILGELSMVYFGHLALLVVKDFKCEASEYLKIKRTHRNQIIEVLHRVRFVNELAKFSYLFGVQSSVVDAHALTDNVVHLSVDYRVMLGRTVIDVEKVFRITVDPRGFCSVKNPILAVLLLKFRYFVRLELQYRYCRLTHCKRLLIGYRCQYMSVLPLSFLSLCTSPFQMLLVQLG